MRPTDRRRRRGRRGWQLPGDAGVELRVRQPRDDEPVLRPDPVRHRGRLGAARHVVPVDRLGDVRHPRDGRCLRGGDRRQRRRDRRLRSSTSRRSTIRSTGRWRPASRSSPTTPTRRTTGWPTSGRTSTGPGSRWASGSSSSSARAPVALFIATPGQLNIQPRIDGAIDAIEESGAPIEVEDIATGAELEEELSTIEAYYLGHTDVAGMFAVDAGSTQGVGQVVQTQDARSGALKGAGGYDLLPTTVELVSSGVLDFTIDQQPYLQGFLPVIVPLPVEAVGRRRPPAGDEHRAGVPRLRHRRSCSSTRRAGSRATTRSRRSSKPAAWPLQRRSCRSTDRQSRATSNGDLTAGPPLEAPPGTGASPFAFRTMDLISRRKEASIAFVARGAVRLLQRVDARLPRHRTTSA